jgi:hypothetical protein
VYNAVLHKAYIMPGVVCNLSNRPVLANTTQVLTGMKQYILCIRYAQSGITVGRAGTRGIPYHTIHIGVCILHVTWLKRGTPILFKCL